MKAKLLKLAACSLATGIAMQVAVAQNGMSTDTRSQTAPGTHEPQAGQMDQQPGLLLSKIKDSKLQGQDGKSLGQVEDVVVNPDTGKIDFLVLGKGGFLGIGEKLVPVPWEAVSVGSNHQLTSTLSADKLQNAPTLDRHYSQLNDPAFANSINQHYGISATGGGETGFGTQRGTGQSDQLNNMPSDQNSQQQPAQTHDQSGAGHTGDSPNQ